WKKDIFFFKLCFCHSEVVRFWVQKYKKWKTLAEILWYHGFLFPRFMADSYWNINTLLISIFDILIEHKRDCLTVWRQNCTSPSTFILFSFFLKNNPWNNMDRRALCE